MYAGRDATSHTSMQRTCVCNARTCVQNTYACASYTLKRTDKLPGRRAHGCACSATEKKTRERGVYVVCGDLSEPLWKPGAGQIRRAKNERDSGIGGSFHKNF